MTTTPDTRVNWRDLDTETMEGRRALEREIARRLGWDVEHTPMSQHRLTHEVADALNLPTHGVVQIHMHREVISAYHEVEYTTTEGASYGHGALEPLPIVICKAWLAWHDAAYPITNTESEGR